MQYMCLIYEPVDGPQLSEKEAEQMFADYGSYTQEALQSVNLIAGA